TPTATVTVSGRTIDKKTGAGVSAEIYLGSTADVRGGGLQTLSDSSGKFTFSGVSPGPYFLNASSNGVQMTRTIDVPDKGISDLEVAFEQGFSVRGRVRPDPTEPEFDLPKLTVGLNPGRSGATEADGNFEIKEVRSCNCTVYVLGLTGDQYIKSVQ